MLDKLKAVNRSLQAIGEVPVNSLASGLPDAEIAEEVLDEVTVEVLQIGWSDNTRESVRVAPDLQTSEIVVPQSWLAVEPAPESVRIGRIALRTDPNDGVRKLFSIDDDTFEFTQPVWLRVTQNVEFNDLSYALQNYISARAARVFQERQMSSVSLDNFTSRSEQEAWQKLTEAELEATNPNALTDNYYMASLTHRNNRLTWR